MTLNEQFPHNEHPKKGETVPKNTELSINTSEGEVLHQGANFFSNTEIKRKEPRGKVVHPEAPAGVFSKRRNIGDTTKARIIKSTVVETKPFEPELAPVETPAEIVQQPIESTQSELPEDSVVMTENLTLEPVTSEQIPEFPQPQKSATEDKLEILKQKNHELDISKGPDAEILKEELESTPQEELARNEVAGISARNKTLEKELPSLKPAPSQEVLELVSKVAKDELVEEHKKKNTPPPSEAEVREKVALARRAARYAAANTYFNRYDWLKKSLEDALNNKDVKKAEESLRLLQEQDLRKEAKRLYDEADRIYWTEVDPRETATPVALSLSKETPAIPPYKAKKEAAGPDVFSYRQSDNVPPQDVFSMGTPVSEKARSPRGTMANSTPLKGIPPSAPEFQKPIPQPQKRSWLNRWTGGLFGK
jgi:hypothetical protein